MSRAAPQKLVGGRQEPTDHGIGDEANGAPEVEPSEAVKREAGVTVLGGTTTRMCATAEPGSAGAMRVARWAARTLTTVMAGVSGPVMTAGNELVNVTTIAQTPAVRIAALIP